MASILKIQKNMDPIFTAAVGKEWRVRRLTGDWKVLLM